MNTAPKFKDVKVIGANTPMEVYRRRDPAVPRGHKDYIMSRGELVEFARCPYKWLLGGHDDDETTATEWGTVMDAMILTPEAFRKDFVVRPEKYKAKVMRCPGCGSESSAKSCKACGCPREEVEVEKDWNENATVCGEWSDAQRKAGKTIVKHEVMEGAKKAFNMFSKDKHLTELVMCSQTQVMIVGTYVDRATGIEVPLKILLDLVPDKHHTRYGKTLADLKTCRDAAPYAWDKAVAEHGYDTQGALYSDLYRAAFPDEERLDWRFAIQENVEPYITGRRILSEQFLEIGRSKYLNALKDYCVCLATGIWPNYDDIGDNRMNNWSFTEPAEWMVSQMYGLGLKLPALPNAKQPYEPSEDLMAGS